MTDAARVFLLSGAILYVLMATVLYRVAGRPFVHWYLSFFQFPFLLRRLFSHDRIVRVWGIASSILCIAIWWYLGTPEGEAHLAAIAAAWR
jgi:hypothetical protein